MHWRLVFTRMVNSLDYFSSLKNHTQFIHKADAARRALQDTSRFWLYLPAYLALLVALGAACRALAHFITNSDVTVYLWATLIVNSAISIGTQCGTEAIRKWSARVRVLLFVFLPVSAFLFNATVLAPLEAEAEINATVSLVVGWAALLCILLIGMRYGSNASGEQRVPLAAPLVPALSLFGLLNSLSVDTIVQICFVIFVAASLYLIAYERLLSRVWKGDRSLASDQENSEYSGLRPVPSLAGRNPFSGLSRIAIGRAAVGYFVACSIWFGIFMGGAALFYHPVEAVLPRVMATPLNAVRSASATLLDWRGAGASATMELRGGNYPLSDREIMKIEVRPINGFATNIPSLWRGRIYEIYSDSRWSADPDTRSVTLRVRRGRMTRVEQAVEEALAKGQHSSEFQNPQQNISPSLARFIPFQAIVDPQRSSSAALYFPGELTGIQGVVQLQAFPNGTYNALSSYRSPAYALQSNVKEERLSALRSAPGLSATELKRWRSDPYDALNLQIDPELKEQLAPIIAQIKKGALSTPRGRFDTPVAKANAIRDYLARTCTYSLSSPLVPANQDAVIFFLTRSKTGACDMFASAMTLLLRAVDVPARLATGYLEPEEILEGQTSFGGNAQDSSASNSMIYIVRERDAHAWVEYYLPGAGWLNYDPTQGTRTTELPLESQIAGILNLPQWNLDFKTLWIPGLGLLLVIAGLCWSFFDFQSKKKVPLNAAEMERARIMEIYGQAVALLSRRVPHAKHQTPLEYEAEVQRAQIAVPAKQEFSALTYLLMSARYRGEPPAMNHQELQACLARLRQAIR